MDGKIAAAREASEAGWKAAVDTAGAPAREAAAREAAEAAEAAWDEAWAALMSGNALAALAALELAATLARGWGDGGPERDAIAVLMGRQRRQRHCADAARIVGEIERPEWRYLRGALADLVGRNVGGWGETTQAMVGVIDALPIDVRAVDVVDLAMDVVAGRYTWRPEVSARLGREEA